jgi:signal transduction histidine kinase
MASSIWGHSIRGYAISIRELVRNLRADFEGAFLLSRKRNSLDEKLARIEKLTTQILERPVIEPLGSDKGAENLPVYNLLKERVKQLVQTEPYEALKVEWNLHPETEVIVRCHPQWLRRALDILLDNAVEALLKVEPARRRLIINSKVVGNKVDIAITDTGPGIPPELHDKVLREQIKKKPGESGTGIGLLMAQAIINAYGGDINYLPDEKEGTTMVVSLPLAGGAPAGN